MPIGAHLAAFGKTFAQPINLALDRIERVARHGLIERPADLGKLLAEGIDRLFDAGAAQGLDLVGDLRRS